MSRWPGKGYCCDLLMRARSIRLSAGDVAAKAAPAGKANDSKEKVTDKQDFGSIMPPLHYEIELTITEHYWRLVS